MRCIMYGIDNWFKMLPSPKNDSPYLEGPCHSGTNLYSHFPSTTPFQNTDKIKKKKKVWRIILRESGGKVVRKWHSSTHIFSVLLFDQPII